MCNSREEGDNHAEGYAASSKDSRHLSRVKPSSGVKEAV